MGLFGIGKKKPERTSEETIALAKQRLFEHSGFEDLQQTFQAMEVNYQKLSQSQAQNPNALVQLKADWAEYAHALARIKAGLIYVAEDVNDQFEGNFQKLAQESLDKALEIENKFKNQLGDSFEPVPQIDLNRDRQINMADYFQR